MNPPEYPTPWQRKTIWTALATVAVAVILALSIALIYCFSHAMAFLQPILVPFAIAGVLAYLLEPAVAKLVQLGTTRHRAVISVFALTTVIFVGVMFWVVPLISKQSVKLARKVPEITLLVRKGVADFAEKIRAKYGVRLIPDELLEVAKPPSKTAPGAKHPNGEKPPETTPPVEPPALAPAPEPPALAPSENPSTPAPAPESKSAGGGAATPSPDRKTAPPAVPPIVDNPEEVLRNFGSGEWLNKALPAIFRAIWNFFSSSLGGFLGFFGFLLSLIIVPLYLFYFLAESPHIAREWRKYVPLRASEFKDEVVDCLLEINSYLIAFFRGQLIVSMINGVVTGTLLAVVGLDFGILIGFGLCFLGIIPYIGITLCWVPAVIIASVQGGGNWLIPATAAWWVFPLVVTGVFTIVQQVDGLFVTPHIVGERVGLHPVTVIFSVFLWSLLLGGLLGAILAVPLTATLKVILKRYVWERTIVAGGPPSPPGAAPAQA